MKWTGLFAGIFWSNAYGLTLEQFYRNINGYIHSIYWDDVRRYFNRLEDTCILWSDRATVRVMVGKLWWAAVSSSPILPQHTGGIAATTSLMLSERQLDLSQQESCTESGLCSNSLPHYDYFGLLEVDSDDEPAALKTKNFSGVWIRNDSQLLIAQQQSLVILLVG